MSENKKKLLYLITQSELGGAQTYVFDLSVNLKNDYDITTAFGEQGGAGEIAEKFKLAGLKCITIPHLKRAVSPLNDVLALIELVKLIKRLKPDIIHLNSSKISVLGSLAAFLAKLTIKNPKSKIIYTAHGWVFNEPGRNSTLYKWAEKLTALFKDRIICVSEYDRQIALDKKIVPSRKLITIHNGIKPVNFLSREDARQKIARITNYKLQITGALIGSIGNLYQTKGYEHLIDAVKHLTDSGLDPTVVIIGDGRERGNLTSWIVQNGLQRRVLLAGRVDNAAQLLSAFDIYVCSSVKEGLSYTLIEAMFAGLPIVATKVGGNPELIKDGRTGLLAESANAESLAARLKTLINNSELGAELGQNAKIKAIQEFNAERMITGTRQVYDNHAR